ncbi:MAG: rhomboid family intramembrane serine protease, partial [Bradyrhizobium sp.]|nr:rhomboid family intramembrane serine protease [Bradyrhizobium sp.]
FFALTIGLNVAIALFAPGLDWGAHLGGFFAGMAVCAVLDALEVAGPKLMRCKFPEFVKVDLGILFAIVAWLTDFSPMAMLVLLVALIITAKIVDVALSLPRGLAWTVAILAVGNALVAGAAVMLILPATTSAIALPPNLVPWAASALRQLIAAASSSPAFATAIVFATVCGSSFLLYWPELARGLRDKGGFAAAGFRAERRRKRGL